MSDQSEPSPMSFSHAAKAAAPGDCSFHEGMRLALQAQAQPWSRDEWRKKKFQIRANKLLEAGILLLGQALGQILFSSLGSGAQSM